MALFSDATGSSMTQDEIATASAFAAAADPANLDQVPAGFTPIENGQLDFSANFLDGEIASNGYFYAGALAPGGEAVAFVNETAGEIAVSFRATNDALDLSAFTLFANDQYLVGFESYLESVARFADENGFEITYVTGVSLGGAAANMLHDSDIGNGAYADAQYFTIASPVIADDETGIVNFGNSNDWAFEAWERGYGDGDIDRGSVTDNVVYFNSEYASSSWSLQYDMSSHGFNAFEKALTALNDTQFYNELTQDDVVVLGMTRDVDMNLALQRTDSSAEDVYYITGANSKVDNVYGTAQNDHMELGAWNDVARGYSGDDVIYGEGGADKLYGYAGNDYINGGNYHDTIDGGYGNDTLIGAGGKDYILGNRGNDYIEGNWGNDKLFGGRDNDILLGGHGNDYLNGGNHTDTLNGGHGTNTLVGGAGRDNFYYDGIGVNTVTDYTFGADTIWIEAEGATQSNVFDYAEEIDGDTIFTFGNSQLLVENMSQDEWSDADIQVLETFDDEFAYI